VVLLDNRRAARTSSTLPKLLGSVRSPIIHKGQDIVGFIGMPIP
jgi:hypothetical protein